MPERSVEHDLADADVAVLRAGVGSAATVVMMVPPIVLFVIGQSSVVQTMATAGIKE